MQKYLVRIKYKGSAYSGYQRQQNSHTVGEEVFRCLKTVFGEVNSLSGCSRTDKGVHALDYAVSFGAERVLPEASVVRAMNANFPGDISAFYCTYVPESFHARYDVVSKEYVYKIYNGRSPDPFWKDFSFFYPSVLDLDKMNQAVRHLLGTHDFTSFMAAGSKVTDCVRTIYSACFDRNGDVVTFRISGNGFLYKMVRLIVGTLLYVSEGKILPEEISSILESRVQTNGFAAPPQGLYLNRVTYERE